MKRPHLSLISASLLLAAALAACGGSGDAKKTSTPIAPTASRTTTATRAAATAAGASTPRPSATPAPAPTDPPTVATPPAEPTTIAIPPTTTTSGGAPTVVVGVIANATMQYYDITGTSAGELRAAMNANGPVDVAGHRNDAYTAWNIDWTWPLNPDSSCALSGATINTTVSVTFPRWQPPAGAPADLVEAWNAYETALVTHESGHVTYVTQSAGDVLAAIKGASCDTAESAAQAAVGKIRQHDIDYDVETNHGYTQGAHFP